jgi:hypothetical protein
MDADGRGAQAKEVRKLAGCLSEGAVGGGDAWITSHADNICNDVTQRGHDSCLAVACGTRSVLAVSDVPELVGAVFPLGDRECACG